MIVTLPKLDNIKNATGGSANEVYIGRAGHGYDGYFGNPVRKNEKCMVCNKVHTRTKEVIKCFEVYARRRINTDPVFKSKVKELTGKTLLCFCWPKHCHGEVLITLCKELNSNTLF
jgi:hypothetical protein